MTGGSEPRRTGIGAEQAAELFLIEHGYRVLARNHHTREGEVDLIVERDDLVVFAEVKLRKRGSMVDPFESVTPAKQRKIVRAALDYVERHALQDRSLRFDVLAVTAGTKKPPREPVIEHLEGAFDSSDGGR